MGIDLSRFKVVHGDKVFNAIALMDETQEQQITAVGNEMSASFLAAKKRSDATLAKLEENPG